MKTGRDLRQCKATVISVRKFGIWFIKNYVIFRNRYTSTAEIKFPITKYSLCQAGMRNQIEKLQEDKENEDL